MKAVLRVTIASLGRVTGMKQGNVLSGYVLLMQRANPSLVGRRRERNNMDSNREAGLFCGFLGIHKWRWSGKGCRCTRCGLETRASSSESIWKFLDVKPSSTYPLSGGGENEKY